MSLPDGPLAAAFPQAAEDQWRGIVETALKGAPFDKLRAKTYDGVAIEPLYPAAGAAGPRALRSAGGRWTGLARVDLGDPETASRLALDELHGGADGLQLVFAGSQGAYGGGLGFDNAEAIARLLENVRLDRGVMVAAEYSPRAPGAPEVLMRLIDRAHIEPSIARVSFGYDPLGASARHGLLPAPWRECAKTFAREVKEAADKGFAFATVCADARAVHAAGGAEAQELAFAILAALAYLRALDDAGVPLEKARGLLAFRLAADADEFLTVAKLRALRRLWARIEETCGATPAPIYIHAETAWRMMSRRDPWSNLLRTTVAAFSAAVGGADAVTVLPFTQALGAPDAFARRLARDTQLVLQEESRMDAVADPVAGAGGFETLTELLSERAWSLFQEIEAGGGLATALEKGSFQTKVRDVAAARARKTAQAREKITGANQFPDIHEAPVATLAPFDAAAMEVTALAGALRTTPLTPRRLAEPFERLRDISDAALARNGARPKIFLANLGKVAAFTARANFAKNFFEAGGIEAVNGEEAHSSAEILEAFRASGAGLACLCSSDAVYAETGEQMAKALAHAGAVVYLAGRPGEQEAKLQSAGVAEFVYAGCNMLDALERALEKAH